MNSSRKRDGKGFAAAWLRHHGYREKVEPRWRRNAESPGLLQGHWLVQLAPASGGCCRRRTSSASNWSTARSSVAMGPPTGMQPCGFAFACLAGGGAHRLHQCHCVLRHASEQGASVCPAGADHRGRQDGARGAPQRPPRLPNPRTVRSWICWRSGSQAALAGR